MHRVFHCCSAARISPLTFCATHLLDWPFPVSADVLNQINQSADPCEDFYEFACGGWMSRNPLTANESSVSGFTALNDDNMEALKTALEQAATNYSQVGYDCFTVRPNTRSSYNVQETQENRKYAFLLCGHLDFESAVIAQKEESSVFVDPAFHSQEWSISDFPRNASHSMSEVCPLSYSLLRWKIIIRTILAISLYISPCTFRAWGWKGFKRVQKRHVLAN